MGSAAPYALWFLAQLGCGGMAMQGSDGGTPADGGSPVTDLMTSVSAGPFPATLPQVVPAAGAIRQPHIVPVFFPNNTLRTQLTSYVQNYVARSASYAVMAEYGVSSTTVGAPVTLSTAPVSSVSDGDIQALIAARVGDGTLPTADGRTIYVLFYPQATTITREGRKSCVDFAAYHGWTQAGGQDAPYAVIPQCSSSSLPSTLPALTVSVSHEITEAVTDPIGLSLNEMNDPYSLWFAPYSGNEVADMCEWLSDYAVNEVGIGTSARIWSNVAMRNKKNPCLPAPSAAPSFFAIPFLPDLRTVQIGSALRQTELLVLSLGSPRSIDVRLSSDATNPSPITAEAEEIPVATLSNPSPAKVLSLTWQEAPAAARVTAAAGSTLHLQISASAAPASAYTTFRVYATISLAGGAKTQTMWAGQVNVR